MSDSKGPVTGSRPKRPANTTSQPVLSFPKDLIYFPQSQINHAEDAVSQRIVALDSWAQRLGESFGIAFTSFTLNPIDPNIATNNLGLALLTTLVVRQERISLERRSGRWGLYFTREPAFLTSERRADTVLLRDAPLDVRERFLEMSEPFFREYMKLCEDRLGHMKTCVNNADRTLQLLENIKLS